MFESVTSARRCWIDLDQGHRMGRAELSDFMDTILVIDDDPALRDVFRIALEFARYRVIDAADGETGLKLYLEERPRIAIVDLHMPRRSGKEVIRQVLEIDPQACIIVVSGDIVVQNMELADFARTLGAKGSLEKPFRRHQLLAVLDDVLKQAA